jgi:phenylacetate-CoA ligase
LCLERLTGRTNDFAILTDGSKVSGLTFYYVTKSIINNDSFVKEFVVKQQSYTTFDVEYVSEIELTLKHKEAIYHTFKKYVSNGLIVNLIKKNVIKITNNGKLKKFERLF